MEMERSALLRFAYATFTMRQRWEATSGAGGGKRDAATMIAGEDTASVAGERRHHASCFDEEEANEQRIEALSVAVSVLQIVLPMCAEWGEKTVTESEAITKILDEIGHLANDAGALRDVVWVLIETLLSADGRDEEDLQRGVVKVLLSWCVQTRTSADGSRVEYVPTPYCDPAMEPVVAVCAALVEDSSAFSVSSHSGGRLLLSALDALVSHLDSVSDPCLDEGEECIV